MRRVRYQVAMSLDGFIADPKDGYSWIPEEPEFDFEELFSQFDTLLVGRRTFALVGDLAAQIADKQVHVFSTTLRQSDYPSVTIVNAEAPEVVARLKSQPGKDIWLYGGGELFRTLLEAGLVDTVEPAVMPVLLGGGRRLLPESGGPYRLQLQRYRNYPASGMMLLEYRVG